MRIFAKTLCVATVLTLTSAWAQNTPGGHWSGNVDLPNQQLGIEIDLGKPAAEWVGTIAIPARNQSGIPLDNISSTNGKWTFRIKSAPGEPTFTGTLSADGKNLAGDFSAGGTAFPFKLTRTGDAVITAPKASAAVEPRFTGIWEGALDTGGATLRLKVTISNGAEGAKALVISLDQGNAEIAASSVEQSGTKFNMKLALIGGEFDAEINKDGSELTGTWSQGDNHFPLTLKKAK